MAKRRFSGWNPHVRSRVERMILEALAKEPDMSIKDMRCYVLKAIHLPGNTSLTHRSLAQLCTSLLRDGKLVHNLECRPTRWSLTVKPN